MLPAHWITNIWMEYPDGSVEKQTLFPGQEPVAVFDVKGQSGKAAVYEYCNLHGLWKKENRSLVGRPKPSVRKRLPGCNTHTRTKRFKPEFSNELRLFVFSF